MGKTQSKEPKPGDLIEIDRGIYKHWAVYVGNGKVIHMTGEENAKIDSSAGGSGTIFFMCGKKFNKAFVKQDDFLHVASGCKAKTNNSKDRKRTPLPAEEIIERAMSKIGKIGYYVLWKNCEHFASWCRYNVEWSEQVHVLHVCNVITLGRERSITFTCYIYITSMKKGSQH